MGRITEDMIRRRAEHNEGMVSTLEEVTLHQQNIEKIEALGQICPHLKILYLQNNLIGRLGNLHKLKELEYLNLAVNNVAKIQNLQRCESLTKLDLTINFVDKPGLLSVASLAVNVHLRDLYLMGNPCADWPGYRQLVVAWLPQLKKLDGADIKPSERIAALQVAPTLEAQLRAELAAEGVDVDAAAAVEDDGVEGSEEVVETGWVDEKGEVRRPWCAATRILEHRENEKNAKDAEDRKNASHAKSALDSGPAQPTRHESFPVLQEGERVWQRNEGKWEFSLDESENRKDVVLDVAVGKFMDSSLIQADIQPGYVRLLIKGKLLQLLLPVEVRPDASTAQRSLASGHLVLTMPKEDPHERATDPAMLRPATASAAFPTPTHNSHIPTQPPSHSHPHPTPSSSSAAAASSQRSHSRSHTPVPLAGARGSSSMPPLPFRINTLTDGHGVTGGGGKGGLSGKRGVSVYNIVSGPGGAGGDDFVIQEVRRAAVIAVAAGQEDDDELPDL
ncbi:MAG: hypothetical protein WDW36_001390 [Sanguina aurantia]